MSKEQFSTQHAQGLITGSRQCLQIKAKVFDKCKLGLKLIYNFLCIVYENYINSVNYIKTLTFKSLIYQIKVYVYLFIIVYFIISVCI